MRFRLRDKVTFRAGPHWDGPTTGEVKAIVHRVHGEGEDTAYTVFVPMCGDLEFRPEDLRHVEVPVGTRVLLKYDDPNRENREATIERVRYHEFDHDDVYNTPVYLLRFDDGQSVETGADRFEVVL